MTSRLLSLIPQTDRAEKLTHSVGRLIWNTSFDDQRMAYQLQEDLSHWSKTTLTQILEQVFEQHCPAGQIWRISTLELDLGEITFDELPAELPKRLRARLSEQLNRLLLNADRQTESPDHSILKSSLPGNSQILSQAHSLNDYIDCFLRNGSAPWWYTGNQDNAAILLQQLQNTPQQIAAIIRNAGKTAAVRQRIVWQYRPDVLKKIVSVLEPHHHEYIEAFSDQLVGLQSKTQQPYSDRMLFERQSWLWILTHLLVDRGSLFNTVFFVESTLKRMADSYRLDYLALLQQLTAAAQSVEYKNHATPRFIQALLAVQQKALSQNAEDLAPERDIDYWQRFTLGLRAEANGEETDHLGELFTLLAGEDAAKMTALLKKEGREAKVRQQLINRLNQGELSRVVSLLAPQDHSFILTHAHQSSEVLSRNKTDERLVWEVILAYLLKNSGSYFNRRQFVDTTLQQMSRARGIGYLVLLDMLCETSMSYQRFELLAILSDLKQQNQAHEDKTRQTDAAYRQALAAYLGSGQVPKVIGNLYLPSPEQLFSILLRRQPRQLASLIANAFKDNGISRQSKIQRLLALIQPADFPLLLRILDVQAARFAVDLIDQLCRWQRRQLLPSLDGFDLCYQLYGVVLDVLIDGLPSGFSVARFLPAFFTELASEHGINRQALAAEILLIDTRDAVKNTFSEPDHQALLQWLSHSSAGPDIDATAPNNAEQSLAQQISALLHYLRGKTAGLQQIGLAHDPKTLSGLLAALLPSHADLVLKCLQQQRDRNLLIQVLLKQAKLSLLQQWLNTLWQTDANPATEFLVQWQSAIAESGLWQGSSTVLQQKLHDIFWMSVLDRALMTGGGLGRDSLDALLTDVVRLSCLQLHIGLKKLNENPCLHQAPLWQAAVVQVAESSAEALSDEPAADMSGKSGEQTFSQDPQRRYLNHPLLPELCRYLLVHGHVPLWLSTHEPLNLAQMIEDLLQTQPQLLRRIINNVRHRHAALFRLYHLIDYRDLLAAATQTDPELKSLSTMLEHFYEGLLQLRFSAVDTALPASLLWQQTLQAWLSGDWQGLSTQRIAAGLSAELVRRYAISAAQVKAEFKRNEPHFPAECRLDLSSEQRQIRTDNLTQDSIPSHRNAAGRQNDSANISKDKPIADFASTAPSDNQPMLPIRINNAGLVLLHGFIGTYLKRLALVEDNAFVSEQARHNAVHHLQYLATGLAATEEQHLVLNKLLCGLSSSDPIELGIDLTAEDKQIGDSLIKAVIQYWKAIGSSSIEGFRGNWLVRNGLLSQNDDHRELVVEKRPYDLLLQSAPFSYNLINFPWMAQPLYVTWPT